MMCERKSDKLDLMEIDKLCSVKDTGKTMKRQTADREKMCKAHFPPEKGYVPKCTKKFVNSSVRQIS